MSMPNTNGVLVHKGYNCSPNVIPTAQSIPMSPTDSTTVKSKLENLDLEDLSDIVTTDPQNGQVLTYNGTSGKWENKNATGGSQTLAGLDDTDITTPSNNDSLVYNSTSSKWENGTIPYATSAGNASTVNNLTVETAVPSGALFTDTTYDEATTSVSGLMSSTDKSKLDGVETGAQVNVQSDWNATSGDAVILNKPTTISGYGITDAKIASGTITLGSNTITPLTQHQSVTDNNPTLAWGTKSKVATIGSTEINVTMPANPDTNTTYTFANGTNGFTVTPSGGTAQTVTVTPSITNNVTGSGTSGYLTKWNGTNTVTNGPALGSDTTKYLRNDGSWVVPPNDNTTYSLTRDGESVKLTPSSGSAQSVGLSGLINGLGEGTSAAQQDDFLVAQYAGGGTTTTTYHRRAVKNIITKSNVDTALGKGSDTTKYYRNDGTWQVPQDPKKFTITGPQPTSYRRGVIALCRVSTAANTSFNSFSSGTITFHRDNGLAGVRVIKYAIENQYATAYAANVSNLGSNFSEVASPTLPKGIGWSWCSFKHNDIYYAGIEFYIEDAELGIIIDDYVGNFEPFGFTWYNTQNSTVLDSEFSNSVSYTTPAHLADEFTVKKAESATDNTKVAKVGDTMSGTLTFTTTNGIAYTGTQATYNMIKFKDNTADTYGNGLILGGGGLTVVGGGESADAVAATYTSGGSETLDLASDGAVTVWTNVQVGATSVDVKKFIFDVAGSLTVPTTVRVNSLASGTDGGLSLYGNNTPTSYGITMRQTGSSTGQLGKHGYVQGDWACYLNFHGNNTATRGWVFRDAALGNIASISTQTGNAVFNGSVTIGGNATNTSGARMKYNSTTQSIDFVFV